MYNIFFKIVIAVFLLNTSCSFSKLQQVKIEGVIKNTANNSIIIRNILPDKRITIDSVSTNQDGKFKSNFSVSETGIYELVIDNLQFITLIISPEENIYITGTADSLIYNYEVRGSVDSENYCIFLKDLYANYSIMDSLSGKYREAKLLPNFDKLKQEIDKRFIETIKKQNESAENYVYRNPSSLSSLLVVNSRFGPDPMLTQDSHSELFKILSDSLLKKYPNNIYAIDFQEKINKYDSLRFADGRDNLLNIGDFAQDISLPNLSNMQKSLLGTKGKLTILLFWDIWDETSRNYNQNLQEIYMQYKNKGLEIFAVSFENDKEKLKEAIKRDKAYWTQVVGISDKTNTYYKKYNLTQIPKIFILNTEGKIISINPTFAQIKELVYNTLNS